MVALYLRSAGLFSSQPCRLSIERCNCFFFQGVENIRDDAALWRLYHGCHSSDFFPFRKDFSSLSTLHSSAHLPFPQPTDVLNHVGSSLCGWQEEETVFQMMLRRQEGKGSKYDLSWPSWAFNDCHLLPLAGSFCGQLDHHDERDTNAITISRIFAKIKAIFLICRSIRWLAEG